MAKPERARGTGWKAGEVGGRAAPDHSKDRGKGCPQDPNTQCSLGGQGSKEAECHGTVGDLNPSDNDKTVTTAAERGLAQPTLSRPPNAHGPLQSPTPTPYPFKFWAFIPWRKLNLTCAIKI